MCYVTDACSWMGCGHEMPVSVLVRPHVRPSGFSQARFCVVSSRVLLLGKALHLDVFPEQVLLPAGLACDDVYLQDSMLPISQGVLYA
jgi:hypothetical protein